MVELAIEQLLEKVVPVMGEWGWWGGGEGAHIVRRSFLFSPTWQVVTSDHSVGNNLQNTFRDLF